MQKASAMARTVQCVASWTGGWSATTLSTSAVSSARYEEVGSVAQKAINPLGHEPLLPAPHAGLRLARRRHDRGGAQPIAAQRDNPRPPDVLLRRSPRCGERFKPDPIR